MTYSDLQRLRQANAASVVCCKICLSFFQVMERNNPYQKQMTEKIPCSSTYKTKIRFTQKYEVQYISFLKPWSKTAHPFQARKTWYILRPSSHSDKTALNTEKLDAAYVKYASFIKSQSKTTYIKISKIRIQIPMILKTIDTPKNVSQHLEWDLISKVL